MQLLWNDTSKYIYFLNVSQASFVCPALWCLKLFPWRNKAYFSGGNLIHNLKTVHILFKINRSIKRHGNIRSHKEMANKIQQLKNKTSLFNFFLKRLKWLLLVLQIKQGIFNLSTCPQQHGYNVIGWRTTGVSHWLQNLVFAFALMAANRERSFCNMLKTSPLRWIHCNTT